MCEKRDSVIDEISIFCYKIFGYKQIIVALILKSAFLCPQHASRTVAMVTVSCWLLLIPISQNTNSRNMNLLLKGKGNRNSGRRRLYL